MPEDVSNIIKESIDNVLQNQQYNEQRVSQWTSSCLESCMKRLTSLNKPFKYVVTCIIMQKTGVVAQWVGCIAAAHMGKCRQPLAGMIAEPGKPSCKLVCVAWAVSMLPVRRLSIQHSGLP